MPRQAGLLACERGVSAVETALVLPIFLAMMFGIINFSLLAWTEASLHFAVEAAARCASVSPGQCADVPAYALSRYHGRALTGPNPFTATLTTCGHKVSANYTYRMSIPFYGDYPVQLSATACFPATPT